MFCLFVSKLIGLCVCFWMVGWQVGSIIGSFVHLLEFFGLFYMPKFSGNDGAFSSDSCFRGK